MTSGIQMRTVRVIRRFKLFDLIEQVWADTNSTEPMRMEVYVNKSGDYIGSRHMGRPDGLVRSIRKYGIQAEKVSDEHSVCSIGRGLDGKWYGWSHRAMVGFGPGDRVFEEEFGDENTPYVKHGEKVIDTDDDAKLAATRFASSVS